MIGNVANTLGWCYSNLIAGESQPEAFRGVPGQRDRSSGNDELLHRISGGAEPLPGAAINSARSTIIQIDEALAWT